MRWKDLLIPWEFRDPVTRRWLVSPGTFMVVFVSILVIAVWVLQGPASLSQPWRALAKFSAFMAIVLLSLNFVLAIRARWFESLFGGLDRQYIVHRLTGRASVLFMVLHPMFLLAHASFSMERLKVFVVPGLDWPVYLGTLSFFVAVALITVTILLRLPYHIWFITHRFMIVALVLAFVHAVLSGSDVRAHPVMMGVLSLVFAAGLVSHLYMSFLYRPLNSRPVKVLSANVFSDIMELKLERPKDLIFDPGQFVFLRFPKVNRLEIFPFSISSDRYEEYIRVSIRASGDTTRKLMDHAGRGDIVKVLGPYGKFGSRYMSHDRDMVWIAGGIGITPFLSMAMNESVHPTGRRIDMFYVMKTLKDAHYDHELARESKRNQNFRYSHWITSDRGRISAGEVERTLGDVRDRVIMLCGPPKMMEDLSRQFREKGIPPKNIIYEDFDLLGH